MQDQSGMEYDKLLLRCLINLYEALMLAAEAHPLEALDLKGVCRGLDTALAELLISDRLMNRKLFYQILLDPEDYNDAYSAVGHVSKALVFAGYPLKVSAKYDLLTFLGSKNIVELLREVFWLSMKPNDARIVRSIPDIFQERSGCTTLRYQPVFMFLLEGFFKAFYLTTVAIVSIHDCQGSINCEINEHLNYSEWGVIIMLVTSCMFEIGEMLNNGDGIVAHFNQIWNVFDAMANISAGIWISLRFYPIYSIYGR